MLHLTQDMRTVTELKRNTREILDQTHKTGRPIVLTVNGRANAVILDVQTYEKKLIAANLGLLLTEAEKEVAEGKTRPLSAFLKDFRNARKIQR